MKKLVLIGILALCIISIGQIANAAVLTFEDLTGWGYMTNGYGGINWEQGGWEYYDNDQYPYTAHSPYERLFTRLFAAPIQWIDPTFVKGAWFAGEEGTVVYEGTYVYLDVYDWDGNLVNTTAKYAMSENPQFIDTGYAGAISKIVVNANKVSTVPFYVMDDLTYAPVPEPSGLLALASGITGMLGFAIRRRR